MEKPTPRPDLAAHIAKVAASWPPLTQAQIDRVSTLIVGGVAA